VPQIVKPEPRADTDPATRRQEDSTSPVGQSQHAPARHREQQVGFFARHSLGELAGQKPRDRDGAGLVRLRRAQDDAAANVRPASARLLLNNSGSNRHPSADARGGVSAFS